MRHTRLIKYFALLILFTYLRADNAIVDEIIKKTQAQFEKANDYQVTMKIQLRVPGFRMPKKKYKVYFKQPNKLKIKSRGFGMLPKTGIFTSPQDNFDNLKNMRLLKRKSVDGKIYIKGDVIVDSLKLKMPNDYAKLGFRPSVTVKIDTNKWVIDNIITELDTLKLVEITNEYKNIDNTFMMPSASTVQYFVKDAKLSGWLKKDITSIVGKNPLAKSNDMVEGKISIIYEDYIINEGIKDKIFD
jgi:hypothetical protein|tara:strand:+ start:11 stop:742 length:732 start_codon:yes stop_codon:yes gene_type:complete